VIPARTNPVIVGAARGLTGSAQAISTCLGGLALQAAALYLWWPKGGVPQALIAEEGPVTLLAVCITLGATFAYLSLRAGVEEFLLPGQRPLGEWLAGSTLGIGAVLGGYLAGHLLHTVLVLGLSTPLLLAAFAVAGGAWAVLLWSIVIVAAHGAFYRLAGACVRLAIVSRDQDAVVATRVLIVGMYVVTAVLAPSASHPLVTFGLFAARPGPEGDLDPFRLGSADGLPPHVEFVLLYALGSGLLVVALAVLAARARRRTSL